MNSLPSDFVTPDLSAPLDLRAHLALVPATAVCKGLVAESFLDEIRRAGIPLVTSKKYVPFRDYPMAEILELKVACALALSPGAPLKDALCNLGRGLFPTFVNTLLGRVMYGVFGSNISAILRLSNKGFEQTQSTGRIDAVQVPPSSLRMSFTNTFTFIDSYHVGVIEGALGACNVEGDVLVRMSSPSDGDLLVRWTPKP